MVTPLSELPPFEPAMPQRPVAFTVQSSMVRDDEVMYKPQSVVLAVLRVPSPLIVVGFRRIIAAEELLMLLVPVTCMFRFEIPLLEMA